MIDVTRWRHLVADMPLCVHDTETTGKDAATCSIVEFAALGYGAASIEAAIAATLAASTDVVQTVVLPVPEWTWSTRINPGVPIPPGATRVHGIADADVAAAPDVHTLAGPLVGLSQSFRIAGYNSNGYDLPILRRQVGVEFAHRLDVMGVVGAVRALPPLAGKVPWGAGGPAALLGLDAFRDKLGAVYAALTGRRLEGAHGAVTDARAAADVLFLCVALYPDLPALGPELAAAAERALCMVQVVDGQLTFTRGKHEGSTVVEVEAMNDGYLGWLLDAPDMDDATKSAVTEAIGEGRALQLLQQRRHRGTSKPRGRKGKDAPAAAE